MSSTSTATGPELLDERSLGGILVHLLAIPTGVVGAALVYLLATSEFTRQNARNALDWHLTVLSLTLVTFGTLFGYAELSAADAANLVVLPTGVSGVVESAIWALVVLWVVVSVWSTLASIVAAGKAVFGTCWRYPFAPALVERIAPRVDRPDAWPVLLAGYAVAAPVVLGVALLGSRVGVGVLPTAFGLLCLIVGTPVAVAAMYRHGQRDRPGNATWRPRVDLHVGAPAACGAGAYLVSRTVTDSINPAGDAAYVFLGAFWLSSLVYLARWRATASA